MQVPAYITRRSLRVLFQANTAQRVNKKGTWRHVTQEGDLYNAIAAKSTRHQMATTDGETVTPQNQRLVRRLIAQAARVRVWDTGSYNSCLIFPR